MWPDSGIRKIRGDRGRFFAIAEKAIPDRNNFIVAGPWYHGEWQSPKGDSIGHHPVSAGMRRRASFARILRRHSSAITCTARERSLAWQASNLSKRLEYLAHLRCLAAENRRRPRIFIFTPMARCPFPRRRSVNAKPYRAICFRSGESCAVPAAADFADLSRRRLAHVGSGRPAFCGSPARRAYFRQRAARPQSHDHRRGCGRSFRIHFRHG